MDKMKRVIAIVLLLALSAGITGCSKKEEKIKHIKSYKTINYYEGEENDYTEFIYNEKGLATEMRSADDKVDITYNFDDHNNPTRVVANRGDKAVTYTMEYEYDGDELKKMIIASLEYDDEKYDLTEQLTEEDFSMPAMYVTILLSLISNYDNFRGVDIECPGTGAIMKRSDADNGFTRNVQLHYYSEVTTEKSKDGTVVTTSLSGNIENNEYVPDHSQKTTYDKDNKLTEMVITSYNPDTSVKFTFEYERHDEGDGYYEEASIKDYKIMVGEQEIKQDVEEVVDEFKIICHYNKDDVPTKREVTTDANTEITYYNGEGAVKRGERYYSDQLFSAFEYEYWD